MKNANQSRVTRNPLNVADPRRQRVADEVRACIARRGKSRAEVESAIGMSQASLSRKLRGLIPFTVDELLRLAHFLDVEASEFFPRERVR